MRIRTSVTMLLMLIASAIYSQKEFTKAQKYLSLKAFDLAVQSYQDALAKYPDFAEGYAELARAYTMLNKLPEALSAYEKAFAKSNDMLPIYKLQYADVLKKMGMYDKSKVILDSYAAHDPEKAKYLQASVEQAKLLLQKEEQYDILNFDGNSNESDFGSSFFNDKIIFCSFRNDIVRPEAKINESYINAPGNEIFAKSLRNRGNEKLGFLRADNMATERIGPITYTRNGNMMAFTRNSFTSGSNQIYSDDSDMSIYIAKTTESGDYTVFQPFSYNQIEYSYAFPCLSNDGSAMYFSSNRPGGYGGFDIYVSYYRDGTWTSPENLGKQINSIGNEITPYFDGLTLYFSSDYLMGLGGYDVFKTWVDNGTWVAAQNMGKGINSPSDDYYLTPNFEEGNYYFTSNRLGGRGKDDIYIARSISQKEELMLASNAEINVPAAVDLQNLTKAPSDISSSEKVTMTKGDAQVVATSEMEKSIDLSDARQILIVKTSLGDIHAENALSQVYFIQLASLQKTDGNVKNFSKVKSYGNLYRFFKDSSVKIKLGFFKDLSLAESILSKVKSEGFRDAFITTDILAYSEYEVIGEADKDSGWIDSYNRESSFKVKLASYLDPMKFDVESVNTLGRLEQWSKGKWTIFILGGYDSLESAQRARLTALNKGFKDAEIVEDAKGVLKRVSLR